MARTSGFDHVATVTADLDRIVAFYQHVFDARITFEMAATPTHPRMVILDLGGGSALNVTEQAADTIAGDRAKPGGRGPIDHYGIAVASLADLDDLVDRPGRGRPAPSGMASSRARSHLDWQIALARAEGAENRPEAGAWAKIRACAAP